jgi:hypothetical protein
MEASWRRVFSLLAFSAAVLSPAMAAPASPQSEAQLVRVSYTEGDVRFNRGNGKSPDLNKPWEQAEVNLPIEQGFALATGSGRAQVEFETGELIYVADNSVVLFKQLTTTDGVPATRMELVSGTVTTAVVPMPKELFEIETPTARFVVTYPENSFDRVDSYLDGMAITPEGKNGADVSDNGGPKIHLQNRQTVIVESGGPVRIDGAKPTSAASDWDQWVSTRYDARYTNLQAALKASGLSWSMPGLTDLYASGTFSPCAPYGTCWEPSAQSVPPPQATQQALPAQRPTSQPPFKPQVLALRSLVGVCAMPLWTGLRHQGSAAVVPSATTVVAETPQELDELMKEAYWWNLRQPWAWAACNYTSSIYRHNHYVFVLRKRRHHHPVRWVKVGGRTGFVPAHPSDRKGQPPRNLKHGVFVVPAQETGKHIELVDFTPKDRVEVLGNPPKEFRPGPYPALAVVAPPEIQAHLIGETAPDAKYAAVKGNGSRITYDYGKGTFVQSGVELAGHAAKPVVLGGLNSRGDFSGALGVRFGGEASRGSGGSSYAGGGTSAVRSSGGGGSSASRGAEAGNFSGGYSGGGSGGGGGGAGGGGGRTK